MKPPFTALLLVLLALLASPAASFTIKSNGPNRLEAETIAKFDRPWAMSFLAPDRLLVTTKPGKLWLVGTDGSTQEVRGLPRAMVGGQGGLGDVVLHPSFSQNRRIYISLVVAGKTSATRRAVVLRGKLDLRGTPKLTDLRTIWTQHPARPGKGHFSHRIAFGPKGKLFITSGDRQEQTRPSAGTWRLARSSA